MRRLPNQMIRVETGSVQFGEDWPGVYIRGDRCQHFAAALATAADKLETKDKNTSQLIILPALKSLERLLRSACVD